MVREALKKKKNLTFVTGGEGGCQRGFITKKKAKMISGSFGAFFFSFSPFFGGGSNPKAGGWILDFAGDVIISRGDSLKLVSPSMIWQCAIPKLIKK